MRRFGMAAVAGGALAWGAGEVQATPLIVGTVEFRDPLAYSAAGSRAFSTASYNVVLTLTQDDRGRLGGQAQVGRSDGSGTTVTIALKGKAKTRGGGRELRIFARGGNGRQGGIRLTGQLIGTSFQVNGRIFGLGPREDFQTTFAVADGLSDLVTIYDSPSSPKGKKGLKSVRAVAIGGGTTVTVSAQQFTNRDKVRFIARGKSFYMNLRGTVDGGGNFTPTNVNTRLSTGRITLSPNEVTTVSQSLFPAP